MYGLKQAAVLAYIQLSKYLKQAGYKLVLGSAGLWVNHTSRTPFYLCVIKFGLKYYIKQEATDFLQMWGKHYKYTVDWKGHHFCGLTLDWNYEKGLVDVSVLNYVRDTLKRLNHVLKVFPQYSPHNYAPIAYAKPNTQ